MVVVVVDCLEGWLAGVDSVVFVSDWWPACWPAVVGAVQVLDRVLLLAEQGRWLNIVLFVVPFDCHCWTLV